MRDLFAKLMDFDDVNRLVGETMTGLSVRYDLGSERDEVGRLIVNKSIAHRDPDVSLYDMMQDGMGVLLDASTEGKASQMVAARTQKVRCVAVDSGLSVLVRPDACVAWTSEDSNTDGLEEALRCWFVPTRASGSAV
jgi:hypothetical protein